ncbi:MULTISPECIES: helix-turn-helix domain-containing protein [Deinococcus]|jgi:DNA-binding HxlR family transcriptional regulator|uniref:HxlR family transcriptional regulator n=2 Tax=Deinococcus soli (ex Cha et al. 2016) TaxID=1309411 RepID=A0A0F7JPB5_9DEIO|nr:MULTISPECIES: helix-turn-helix domain-containing protein [Deinococcus]AKH16445.1 HxlR family transcriptional regulator [Deinococcus soli (ex Cha et al. 2016)]MDK2010935.1 helix-turn-helix domain-containing protein [Deinococcus sp. 43]MDR6216909.1 DNA-binding HxlR family transcriptional regulator [Deinococcus soli (ex Cha et al. 2016)]MDR6327730.1 DNA-binding HxlR family transcriptional regulator [Deinococcus soli (ex Cha et al. 2016)]MDR6750005.1 DNA-binding HxlR family transcriptional regu
MSTEHTGFCPVYRAIGVLQEKWVLHIVRALLNGEKGFNELARAVGGCNSATLTQRLEHLETLTLITKRTEDSHGKLARSVYSLTPAGLELQSVIDAIDGWAKTHLNAPAPTTPDLPATPEASPC